MDHSILKGKLSDEQLSIPRKAAAILGFLAADALEEESCVETWSELTDVADDLWKIESVIGGYFRYKVPAGPRERRPVVDGIDMEVVSGYGDRDFDD